MLVKGRRVTYVEVDVEDEEIIRQAIHCVRRRLNLGESTQLNEERTQIVYYDPGYGGSGTWRTLRKVTEKETVAFEVVEFLEELIYPGKKGIF